MEGGAKGAELMLHYDYVKRRQQRLISEGRCPRCGKEAAPHRLCVSCRYGMHVTRMLEHCVSVGWLRADNVTWLDEPNAGRVGTRRYWIGDEGKFSLVREPREFKQRVPRIGGQPVDVEKMILEIVTASGGRGIHEREILAEIGRRRTAGTRPPHPGGEGKFTSGQGGS